MTTPADFSLTVERSHFYALLTPLANPGEMDALLKGRRRDYRKAVHHCWAYRIARDSPAPSLRAPASSSLRDPVSSWDPALAGLASSSHPPSAGLASSSHPPSAGLASSSHPPSAGFLEMSKDDGEVGHPGRVLLELLRKYDLEGALVVSRIFGGVKLGVGGVSRAFRDAGQGAINGYLRGRAAHG